METCYCCGHETDDPWYALDSKNETVYLCDSCSSELAYHVDVFYRAKMLSMRNEKEFQNQRREKAQVPEQMRLV